MPVDISRAGWCTIKLKIAYLLKCCYSEVLYLSIWFRWDLHLYGGQYLHMWKQKQVFVKDKANCSFCISDLPLITVCLTLGRLCLFIKVCYSISVLDLGFGTVSYMIYAFIDDCYSTFTRLCIKEWKDRKALNLLHNILEHQWPYFYQQNWKYFKKQISNIHCPGQKGKWSPIFN